MSPDDRVYPHERWAGGDGAAHEKTQRHQLAAWAAQAEFAQQRLVKGARVWRCIATPPATRSPAW